MNMPDLRELRRELAAGKRPATLRAIAEAADVGLAWVRAVAYGQIGNPGWARVTRLRAALAKMRRRG